jgi:hypothetical protein
MPTSSKYIQLSSSVLMEYVYADQTVINTPGNQFRLNTTTNPIWLMQNGHTNVPQVFNSDANEYIQNGLPIGTGNVRNRAFAKIKPYEGALLDIDKVIAYNDYDPLLTPTASLPITFVNPQAPVYDTIRLHLAQGFNFENNDGLILSVDITRKDGKLINILDWVYNKSDTWETLNPSPFFFGGRVYDSYLEVRILSLYNLIYDYWLGPLTPDSVVLKISDGLGVLRDQLIQTKFAWVKGRKTIEDQDYITFYDGVSVDIPTRDQFESVSAVIQESTSGDYIEFYAAYNGQIIENFILDLNSSGYDFIVLHDLTVSEYVWDGSSSYNWITTDDLQISQTSDYDQPNVFRPVIKNNSSIAYKIDYVVRLYNRNDNTQIWKTASMVSYSAAKYGRKLLSINLGQNPVQSKVYNQNVVKDITINRVSEPVLDNAKYITSFLTNSSISLSYQTINTIDASNSTIPQATQSTLQAQSKSNTQIFDNGLGRVVIPNNTSYLKFNLYQKANNINSSINLSGLGDFILTFTTNQGESLDVQEFPSPFVSKSKGEMVFRITENEAKNILGFTNKTFNIFLKNDKGEETFLYSGKFYSVEEFQNISETDAVTKAQQQITYLNTALLASQNQVNTQQQTIVSLINQNKALASDDVTDSQKIAALSSTIDDLNKEISRLSTELALAISSIQLSNGLPAIEETSIVIDTGTQVAETTVTPPSTVTATQSVSPSSPGKPNTSESYQESKVETNKANIKDTQASNFEVKDESKQFNSSPNNQSTNPNTKL